MRASGPLSHIVFKIQAAVAVCLAAVTESLPILGLDLF
jgi:hypothetical protein